MADMWVLVADSGVANLYAARHLRARLRLLESFEHPPSRQSGRELASDAPGRVHERFGPGRHSLDTRGQVRTEEAHRFARELGRYLHAALGRARFDRLIIMAAPAFLGVLREELDKTVLAAVVAEVPKNLVEHDASDIEAHIP